MAEEIPTTTQTVTLAELIGAVATSDPELAAALSDLQSTSDGAPQSSSGLPGTAVSGPGYNPDPDPEPATWPLWLFPAAMAVAAVYVFKVR